MKSVDAIKISLWLFMIWWSQEKVCLPWIGPLEWKLQWDLLKGLPTFMKIVSIRFQFLLLIIIFFCFASLSFSYLLHLLMNSGSPRIIHRDIKASNVLLDFSFEAKVSHIYVLFYMKSMYLLFFNYLSISLHSNVHLDQVSDFGLAKLTSDNNTHVSTRVMGTFG